MNRQQKSEVIDLLKGSLSKSTGTFLVEYKGLTVDQLQALRRSLKGVHGSLRVTKARLMKRAVDHMDDVVGLTPYLKGQVGLVFASEDPIAVAKMLYGYTKNNASLQLLAGSMDASIFDGKTIIRIAQLPSREVLLSQLVGIIHGSFAQLIRICEIASTQ